MNKYFICCEKCIETIGKVHGNAIKLWMDLCVLQMNEQSVRLDHNSGSLPTLRFLEQKGFIVSTDLNDQIIVKVLGYLQTDDQHGFCIKGGKHD